MNFYEVQKMVYLSVALAFSISSVCCPAFAHTGEGIQKSSIVLNNCVKSYHQRLNHEKLQINHSALCNSTKLLKTSNYQNHENNRTVAASSTTYWNMPNPVTVTNGVLTDSSSSAAYYFKVTRPSFTFLKIKSTNANIVAQLYMSTDSGYKQTNFYNLSSSSGFSDIVLPVGDYCMAVASKDGTARGNYTLMFNRSNKSDAKNLVYVSENLDKVTLHYGAMDFECNGTALFYNDHLTWEEHWTFVSGNSYWGRDQQINHIKPKLYAVGSYTTTYTSSDHTNSSTNHALYIEAGVGTQWSYMTSQYIDIGSAHHTMDPMDFRGKKTPRPLDKDDMSYGPHYIIFDLEKNKVVDFASPLNYWYTKGGKKYSGNITDTFNA